MATPTIRTLRLSVIAASVCVRVSACVRACVKERERERAILCREWRGWFTQKWLGPIVSNVYIMLD